MGQERRRYSVGKRASGRACATCKGQEEDLQKVIGLAVSMARVLRRLFAGGSLTRCVAAAGEETGQAVSFQLPI